MDSETSASRVTLRDGFAVLGVAIREEPRIFTLAVLFSGLYGAMTVLAASAVGWATEHAIIPAFRDGRTSAGTLATAALLVAGVSLAKVTGVIGRRILAGIMSYRLQATYRLRVTTSFLRLPLSWHQAHPTGQLLASASSDVESAWWVIAPFPMAVGVLVMLLSAIASMLLADVPLALIGVLIFPMVMLVNITYQRALSPLAGRALHLRAELAEIAHESFDGALVVKTLGREVSETARFAKVADQLRATNVSIGRYRGLFDPVLEAMPILGVVTVLVVGSSRVESGAINAGTLVQVAYLLLSVAFPLRAIGWVLGDLPRAVIGYRRLRAVIDAEGSMPYGPSELPASERAARLELSGVGYSYPGAEPVLTDVSLAVSPGRTVALVGPTGSGKSTLAGLTVRLVDPSHGEVVLDGVRASELARGVVPAQAALVAQQAFLFDDTVRGNVTLGVHYTDEEVWAALQVAQAHRFVHALPDGLQTQIGERGATLSGGQRQRLALARAVVRRPRLLVLDDATSAVDPHVEQQILAGLRDGEHPASVLVVAYRKATIALADEVAYLERGRIQARGTHQELLASSAGYRDLVTAYEQDAADREAAEHLEELEQDLERQPEQEEVA